MILAKVPTSDAERLVRQLRAILAYAMVPDERITLSFELFRSGVVPSLDGVEDVPGWSALWSGCLPNAYVAEHASNASIEARWQSTNGVSVVFWRPIDNPVFDFDCATPPKYGVTLELVGKLPIPPNLIASARELVPNGKYRVSDLHDRGQITTMHQWTSIAAEEAIALCAWLMDDTGIGTFNLVSKTITGTLREITFPPEVYVHSGTFSPTVFFGVLARKASLLNSTFSSAENLLRILTHRGVPFSRVDVSRNYLRWPSESGVIARGSALNVAALEADYSTATLTADFEQIGRTGPSKRQQIAAFNTFWRGWSEGLTGRADSKGSRLDY